MSTLFVDGGMVANELLMQFQADVLGVPVVRPVVSETTALGAAFAAGLAVGFFESLDEIRSLWVEGRRWEPKMDGAQREGLLAGWREAVGARCRGLRPSRSHCNSPDRCSVDG